MKSVLVVCAHPDDEVLGCGGYIAKRTLMGDRVSVVFVSTGVGARASTDIERDTSLRRDAAERSARILGVSELYFGNFSDNQLDTVPLLEIIKFVEKFVEKESPSTVLTHFGADLNIDHSVTSAAVVTATRPIPNLQVDKLLFFETASSTEWQVTSGNFGFSPNWYEDISQTLEQKLAALREYDTELRPWPHARSIRAVESLARWRGASCGLDAAESFVLGRRIAV